MEWDIVSPKNFLTFPNDVKGYLTMPKTIKTALRKVQKKTRHLLVLLSSFFGKNFGLHPFYDMQKLSVSDKPVIFDVGANIGQTVKNFTRIFRQCSVHAFEPSRVTFHSLENNTRSFRAGRDVRDVIVNNCALGSTCGTQTFIENSHPDMSSFLEPSRDCWGEITAESRVEVNTVDAYCHKQGIDHIDILKTDTQGFDFEVLKGSQRLLDGNRIHMIYMEIIFSDMYTDQPSFEVIYQFLMDNRFRLVSFYDFHHTHKLASWCEALFVNPAYRSDH